MSEKQYNLRAGYYHNYTGIGRDTDENLTTNKVVDLLNNQEERIKELEKENASMKGRIINAMIESNQVECNCSTCVCEDYVNEELKKW